KNGRGASCYDDVDRHSHQLRGEVGKPFGASIGRAILDDVALPLDVAQIPEPATKSIEVGRVGGGGYRFQDADAPNLSALLRGYGQRPRDSRAAEQRDELASLHLAPLSWQLAQQLLPDPYHLLL